MVNWDRYYAETQWMDRYYYNMERLLRTYVGSYGRVLELGVGRGESARFMQNIDRYPDATYYGIDGNQQVVEEVKTRYPMLAPNIACCDFTKEIPFEPEFDVIFERASIAHNKMGDIEDCVALIWDVLKPGGLFVSSDWFSTAHSECSRGAEIERNTRTEYPDGQFGSIELVHFSDFSELVGLFSGFEGLHLCERVERYPMPNALMPYKRQFRWASPAFGMLDYRSAVWDLVMRKPL